MNNNFFWGVDFHPTPTDVIDRMLMDVDCADKVVLEPSAGAGAIVDDIVKALCFLTGTNYDTIGSINQHFYKRDVEWGEWTEWVFFKVRGYKKGTMHFEFLDEDVWYKFNAAVAKAKGWELPQNTRKRNGKGRN